MDGYSSTQDANLVSQTTHKKKSETTQLCQEALNERYISQNIDNFNVQFRTDRTLNKFIELNIKHMERNKLTELITTEVKEKMQEKMQESKLEVQVQILDPQVREMVTKMQEADERIKKTGQAFKRIDLRLQKEDATNLSETEFLKKVEMRVKKITKLRQQIADLDKQLSKIQSSTIVKLQEVSKMQIWHSSQANQTRENSTVVLKRSKTIQKLVEPNTIETEEKMQRSKEESDPQMQEILARLRQSDMHQGVTQGIDFEDPGWPQKFQAKIANFSVAECQKQAEIIKKRKQKRNKLMKEFQELKQRPTALADGTRANQRKEITQEVCGGNRAK